jgi:hypothetical protein
MRFPSRGPRARQLTEEGELTKLALVCMGLGWLLVGLYIFSGFTGCL